jgi:hypothetical protein
MARAMILHSSTLWKNVQWPMTVKYAIITCQIQRASVLMTFFQAVLFLGTAYFQSMLGDALSLYLILKFKLEKNFLAGNHAPYKMSLWDSVLSIPVMSISCCV